jgi:hypothetical protein
MNWKLRAGALLTSRARAAGLSAALMAIVMSLAIANPTDASAHSLGQRYSAGVMTSAEATGLAPALMAELVAAGWTPASAASGGPSCQYDPDHIIKTCFQRGKGTIVEVWGSLTAQFGHAQAIGLWSYLGQHPTIRKALGGCVSGAIGGIVTTAVAGPGVSVTAGVLGGCVAGTLGYFWTR